MWWLGQSYWPSHPFWVSSGARRCWQQSAAVTAVSLSPLLSPRRERHGIKPTLVFSSNREVSRKNEVELSKLATKEVGAPFPRLPQPPPCLCPLETNAKKSMVATVAMGSQHYLLGERWLWQL
mmetsp:Transcript_25053/g.69960  ORF Transcript_25053/g.69960 Transcript_25053/m.69960 type:complete len:123 (+) Transcript_25053:1447-1815(+)